MLCPANVLGHLLTTRLVLTGAPHVEFGKLPHSHSGRRAVKRSVIPSAVFDFTGVNISTSTESL
jgi:hypothetical protein